MQILEEDDVYCDFVMIISKSKRPIVVLLLDISLPTLS